MTIDDMVILADLWTTLSSNIHGSVVEKLTLPGNMTGRQFDRDFVCLKLPNFPQWGGGADDNDSWEDYVSDAVKYIDFNEV